MLDSENIKDWVVDRFKLAIKSVLDGSEDICVSRLLHIGDVAGYVESLGSKVEELKTNGWQYDFWQNYKINSKYYCLSGSGYYSGLEFSEISEESAFCLLSHLRRRRCRS